MNTLAVYVPTEDSELRDEIRPGSGIVGSEYGDTGRLRVDYEGDIEMYNSFEDRLKRAAERHTWERPDGRRGYPTSACAYVDPSEVIQVGEYDLDAEELRVSDEERISSWRIPPRTPM